MATRRSPMTTASLALGADRPGPDASACENGRPRRFAGPGDPTSAAADRRAEVRRQLRRRRRQDPEGGGQDRSRQGVRQGRGRGRLRHGRHDRRAAGARQAGRGEPRPARARHAALRRRAHRDGARLDSAQRPRHPRRQLHGLAVGHRDQRRPRQRAHRRSAAVPRAGRAGARQGRHRGRLSRRLVQEGSHDAGPRRLGHHGRRPRRGARRRL